jgi:F like protein
MSRADDALQLREPLLAQADAPARRLLEAYVRAWALVRADLEAAALAAAENIADPSNPLAWRTARLTAALTALDGQVQRLARLGQVEATGRAAAIAELAPQVQRQLAALAGIALRLPRQRELELIVGRATQRITRDFATLPTGVQAAIRDGLLRGVAGGLGPRQAAARIAANARDGLGRGLTRSLVISRTELLDVSRAATRAVYLANSDQVTGWRWLASLTPRTCPACWNMHNTMHKPEETLEGHVACRCCQVPILFGDDGADDLGDPREQFAKLDRKDQLAVMGPRRLAYLESGGSWSRLTRRVDTLGWRPAIQVAPASSLT